MDHADTSRRNVLKAGAALALAAAATGVRAAGAAKAQSDDALANLGAREAVQRIREGAIMVEAYLAALIRRADARTALNAFITLRPEQVLERARAVDRARARGDKLGPAAGLPIAVKDQIAAAGYPATGGNGALKGYVPRQSATVVAALESAGAIVFGKTNTPDMVAGFSLEVGAAGINPWFGGTKNPYDARRSPGATSCGNAAALAARIIPAAVGEDTTGSVRFPSAFCGTAGLRPSTWTLENALGERKPKRYSDEGIIIPPAGLQDTFGPMARSVADAAFLDHLITSREAPAVQLKGARIAVPRADYWQADDVEPGVAAVMMNALNQLREAGAVLIEIDFGAARNLYDDRLKSALPFGSPNLKAWLSANLPGVSEEEVLARRGNASDFGKEGAPLSAAERRKILLHARSAYLDIFKTHNVAALASPTVPIIAPLLRPDGEKAGQTILIRGKPVSELWTVASNIFWGPPLGAAGVSLPAGLSEGMPVGLQLEAPSGSDLQLLGLGIAVENVLGPIPPPP